MYEVDERDRVVALTDVPQCDTGAPEPAIFATEHLVLLAYRMLDDPDAISPVDMVGILEEGVWSGARTAVITMPHADLRFGGPNDETLKGHPLASRGLESYGAFEVLESSWIRRMEKVNAVHSRHSRERFMRGKRHLIFTFHDSMVECITGSYTTEIVKMEGPERVIAARAFEKMRSREYPIFPA